MGWFKLWAPSGALDSRSYGTADVASAVSTPEADVEEVEVPGKSGSVIIPKNRWKNIDRTFSVFISLSNWNTIVSKLQECANGYYMLEDSWNTGHFYMARLRSCKLVQSTPLLQKGVLQIVFDCQPQRWETAGAEWTEFSSASWQVSNAGRILKAPAAIKIKPNEGQEDDEGYFNNIITVSFYSPTHNPETDPPKVIYTARWPAYGSLVIDSLTHDMYIGTEYVITPGSSDPAPTPAYNYVTVSATGSPPSNWPEIPAGWSMSVSVTGNTGVESYLARWCTL